MDPEAEFERYCERFGARVRERRDELGYTQEEMAEFGFSLRHYQRIEAGRSVTYGPSGSWPTRSRWTRASCYRH